MKKRKIEIIIKSSGEIEIEAVHFEGSDCEKATEFLEKSLGQVMERKRKIEFYNRRKPKNIQRLGN